MATVYKIHPAIGIARVGNSPDFFIGPELLGEELNPQGGFKDNQCRVKKQAARFRIFAHHDDNTVSEITSADAEITWTVHLVNSKAAHPGRTNTGSAADLTIDPGARTINGPNLNKAFDSGTIAFSGAPVTTVVLGEMRTDTDNRLVVLGGSGISASPPPAHSLGGFWSSVGWYDDVSDGPVTATIKLLIDNSTPDVVPAWVLVAPPKFAPHQQSVITLYDRITEAMVKGGLLTAPTTTSYTNDIYPILQRARDTQWVEQVPGYAHNWMDPVLTPSVKTVIFNKLTLPNNPPTSAQDMPLLNSTSNDGSLTSVQYQHLTNWVNNVNFTNDWTGVPSPQTSITPDGLDRAALENCVGGAFYPGIETGGLPTDYRPAIDPSIYMEAYRLKAATLPGTLTHVMALPWQNDFFACANNWWPVPRPNKVIRNSISGQLFTGTIVTSAQEMVEKWHNLGFILRNGAQHTEFDSCTVPSIQLTTPTLNFFNIPQGPMGMARQAALAITFEVISPSASVTLQYATGGVPSNPQLSAYNTFANAGPTSGSGIAIAQLWIIYSTTSVGSVLPLQTVTVETSDGTQSWNITIMGNTIARKTVATTMVLDRSGSMSEDAGDGQSKHDSLKQAAGIFVDLMVEGDGVGIVSFNNDAQVLQSVLPLGDGTLTDSNRGATKDIINGPGLTPSGSTSIGDGIYEASGVLTSASSSFDLKAMVVLTDGVENAPKYIAEVASLINADTYSIGLGQPQNISVPALQEISGNNGGYLLVTGAITTNNRFELTKYFVQILAGISNAEIVLDPTGQIISGHVEKIPFQLTEADSGVDVILLTPDTKIVDFRLLTPSGQIIEPWLAMSKPGMRFILSNGVSYYRLALPFEYMPNRFDAGGTWHALLTMGEPRLKRSDTADGVDDSIRKPIPQVPTTATSSRGLGLQHGSIIAAEDLAKYPISATNMRASGDRRYSAQYSIVVNAYSNISLTAHIVQNSFEPGASVQLYASLIQSGIPGVINGYVWAEVRSPNGTKINLPLEGTGAGEFMASYNTSVSGIYQFRIRAIGTSLAGQKFTREKTLTVAVWHGGNSTLDPSRSPKATEAYLCELLQCLLRKNGAITVELEKRLEAMGFNLAQAKECFGSLCRADSLGER